MATATIGIIGTKTAQLEQLVGAAGMKAVVLQPAQYATNARPMSSPPDVVLVDVRENRELLSVIPGLKRRHPAIGVAIVATSLEPELMLDAMRAGVSECLTEPLTQGALEASFSHVMVQRAAPVEGRVFVIIGAKGGVGSTTIAVNLAEALARKLGDSLLIDLQTAGDAGIFLGTEPRFTVGEALENTHRLDETFFHGLVVRTRSGLDLLGSSPELTPPAVDVRRFRELLNFAVRAYRAVVIDLPRNSPLLDALEPASIFVVVNHELPTIRSAYRLVARLRQRNSGDRISLLVNRTDRNSEISAEDIEKAANAKVKFSFPSDYKAAVAAVNKGELLARSTQGRLAGAFHAFAESLTGERREPEADGRMFGWLTPRRSTTD